MTPCGVRRSGWKLYAFCVLALQADLPPGDAAVVALHAQAAHLSPRLRAWIDLIGGTDYSFIRNQGFTIGYNGVRLDNYRKNPVIQNAHKYGDVLDTIGKALITEVRDGALFQRIEFAVEVNPIARIAYGLYRGGQLLA